MVFLSGGNLAVSQVSVHFLMLLMKLVHLISVIIHVEKMLVIFVRSRQRVLRANRAIILDLLSIAFVVVIVTIAIINEKAVVVIAVVVAVRLSATVAARLLLLQLVLHLLRPSPLDAATAPTGASEVFISARLDDVLAVEILVERVPAEICE